jgi:hypothetical protein
MSKLDGQMQEQAVNLESCTDEELKAHQNDPTVHSDVARMCGLLLFARKLRRSGQIDNALRIERAFDRLYEVLPTHLRW